MADMGLAGMMGAAGVGDELGTIIQQRMQQAQLAQQQQAHQDQMQMQQRQLDQQDALTRLKYEELAQAKREAEAQRQATLNEAIRKENVAQFSQVMPYSDAANPGTAITDEEHGQLTRPVAQGGMGILPMLMSQHTAPGPTTPNTMEIPNAIAAQPQGEPGTTSMIPLPGTMSNSPQPNLVTNWYRTKTQSDLDKEAAIAERERQGKYAADLALLAAQARKPEEKPVKVQYKDKVTGRNVVEWRLPSTIIGQQFDAPTTGAVENRLESAEAVLQTADDIKRALSNPEVAAQLGPIMGRYNKMADWIGAPPPELSELAGQIHSFAMANMGVHGMRSSEGARDLIKLYDQKHTPESLIAGIMGLTAFSKHFMENEGRTVNAGGGGTEHKVGEMKTFPNGKKGRWDGTGWELVK